MSAFDDLIPGKKSAGKFDDLIPKEPAPATYNPAGISALDPITTQVGGFLDAAQHHLVNTPIGIGQLAGHTADAIVQGVAGGSDYAKGVHARYSALDHEVAQREADYQARTKGNAGSYAGAVAGEVAPFLAEAPVKGLQLVGDAVAGHLPQIVRKAASLGTQGAVMGAAQPVTSDGSYAKQKAEQVGAGTVIGAGIPSLAAGVGQLAKVARPLVAPDSVAAANLARLYGSDPATLDALHNTPEYVPGETVTAAQALKTPTAVMVEKALRNRPDMKAHFIQNDNVNNALRLGVVSAHAGDETAMSAAKGARSYQPVLDSMHGVNVDPTSIVDALQKLEVSGHDKAMSAASKHLGLIAKQTLPDGTIPATALDNIRQNIVTMLTSDTGKVDKVAVAKYAPVATRIISAIDAKAPGYRPGLAAFRADSVPINTMEASRRIMAPVADSSPNSAGDPVLTLNRLNSGLNRADKSRYGLSPQARADMGNVQKSLQRAGVSNSITSAGSDSAYNLQADGWLTKQLLGPTMSGPTVNGYGMTAGLGALAGHSVAPGLLGEFGGASLAAGLKKGAQLVNDRIAMRVAKGAMDSKEAARMIESFIAQNPGQRSALLRRYPQWAAMIGADNTKQLTH